MQRSGRKVMVSAIVVLTAGCSSMFGDNLEDFIPADAVVVEQADCLLPDIRDELQEFNVWNTAGSPSTIPPGYPPSDFRPVAMVRCERGENAAGTPTIDTVRLDGDIATVVDAFRAPSRQYVGGNTMVSCAIRELTPAGLWFVDTEGRAIRPQWPLRPCGFLPEPLSPLNALHEESRTQIPVEGVPADDPGVCYPSHRSIFDVTTTEDVESAITRDKQSTGPMLGQTELATPIDDVERLQVCRFGGSPEGFVEESRARLTLEASKQLMRAAADGPVAPPCTEVASRTAEILVRRPDGSGGTPLSAELDGCRRIEFGGYRAIPANAANLLLPTT